MAEDKKSIIPFGEENPVKLKVPPKACAACGGKFIPYGKNAVYCPACRKLTQQKREAMRDERAIRIANGEIKETDVVTYIDESRRKKMSKEAKQEKKLEQKDQERPTLPEGWEEERKAMVEGSLAVEEKIKDEVLRRIIGVIQQQFGVRLLVESDLIPMTMSIGGRRFAGWYNRIEEKGDGDA